MKELKCCKICPRECKVNRDIELGFCKMNSSIKVARIALHYFEEPPISGCNGSGAIFFSGCNLKCLFCQNYEISTNNFGKEISIEQLANKMIELQNKNAHNINLVTPTHFIPQIKESIILAKEKGLSIPIIYNSSGYEKKESLKLLEGLIDVYLPDFKYFDDNLAIKYSKAPNYTKYAKESIEEMYRQVGKPQFDSNGIIKKGVIVRHMLLPEEKEDSKKIINYLYNKYKDNIYISIMNQYTPLEHVKDISSLNHKVNDNDYDEVINYALDLGIKNAFMQVGDTCSESFIPEFDLTGL